MLRHVRTVFPGVYRPRSRFPFPHWCCSGPLVLRNAHIVIIRHHKRASLALHASMQSTTIRTAAYTTPDKLLARPPPPLCDGIRDPRQLVDRQSLCATPLGSGLTSDPCETALFDAMCTVVPSTNNIWNHQQQ